MLSMVALRAPELPYLPFWVGFLGVRGVGLGCRACGRAYVRRGAGRGFADCRLGSGRWAKPMGYTCALLLPSRMGDLLGAPSRQRVADGLNFVILRAKRSGGWARSVKAKRSDGG